MYWQTTRFRVDLRVPRVMGIVNATPDSFSDGGAYASARDAVAHCERLVAEGADILDIGGESTRPGAERPSAEEELARVLPVVRHAVRLGVPVSVDTSRAEVIAAVLAEGADIVNDVRALRETGALAAVAESSTAGICLMHMRGEPRSMQSAPVEGDVVAEVRAFLADRIAAARAAGIGDERMAVDPGVGFGKTPAQNLELLRRQPELLALGAPLLVGWSRKSTIGIITGRSVAAERCAGSVAAALAAIARGAHIVRVHDVAATVDAVRVWRAAECMAGASANEGA